jgi:surfeit locus 1 family protein
MGLNGGGATESGQRGTWRFRPGLASTLAVLFLMPPLLLLGFWQLDRARQKAGLQTAFVEHFDRVPMPLREIVAPGDFANLYRRVIASGQYDGERQLLLDNQVRDGRPGYHVLTPLRLADGTAILVNRGWIPLGESRQVLPEIAVTTEPVTVDGWLAQPANPGIRLGDAGGADRRWPRVLQYVDYDRLASILEYPLHPAILLMAPDASGGYWRDWQPRFGDIGPERHRGYAVQWFALTAALVILYLAVNVRRVPVHSQVESGEHHSRISENDGPHKS